MLAEEVVLVGGGEAGVAIGRADHAEAVGVHPQPLLQQQAQPERRARILVRQHLTRLGLGEIEVAHVPALEIGELVVRRQEGMRLAVTLDLGDLVERLPARAGLGIGAVEVSTGEGVDHREHAPVGEIAIMGDRQHLAAGPFLVGGQPAPEVLRVVAAGRAQGGVGLDLPGLVATIPVDDDPVEVVAPGVRRPLVADEGGEPAGLIRLVGCRDDLAPGGAEGARARHGEHRRAHSSAPKARTICSAAATACSPPARTMSCQRRPFGSDRTSGSPATSRGKKPMPSEWSATTRKSSGRERRTGCRVAEISSSPLAKR